MSNKLDRRDFLKKFMYASSGTLAGLSLEEKALIDWASGKNRNKELTASFGNLPKGKIGGLDVSRLICGGNPLMGGAHARDLIYTSSLMKHYFTDEKIIETLELCIEGGVNTLIIHITPEPFERLVKIANRFAKEGRMQWIAQCVSITKDFPDKKLSKEHFKTINIGIDNGAVGAFVVGYVSDRWVKAKRIDFHGEVIDFIKQNGLVAGVGGHSKHVPIECEKAGLDHDFYFKTIHNDTYWSALPREERRPFLVDSNESDDHDCIWAQYPEDTIDFMKTVKKPWIGYKVLAAGAIHPREGFKFAFENGADFACVGMFDFQVAEDIAIAKRVLKKLKKTGRDRPWRG